MIDVKNERQMSSAQIGMGLLYLFTAGLRLVGTIMDLVTHKRLAF